MKGFLLIVPCGLHPTQEVQPYRFKQLSITQQQYNLPQSYQYYWLRQLSY